MRPTLRPGLVSVLLLASFSLALQPPAYARKTEKNRKESSRAHVLWRDPGHIPSRGLDARAAPLGLGA